MMVLRLEGSNKKLNQGHSVSDTKKPLVINY